MNITKSVKTFVHYLPKLYIGFKNPAQLCCFEIQFFAILIQSTVIINSNFKASLSRMQLCAKPVFIAVPIDKI